MKEELYIKGESVDLGDSEITLNFKSNLLGDISKITASNSYTITLPRTNKNIRLLDFPDVAGHESYMMRDYFNAEYYRNGIKLFDAKAVLISCSEDGFNVALTWGIDDRITNIIGNGRSIQEFANEYFEWNQDSKYDNGEDSSEYPQNGYIRHDVGVAIDGNRGSIFIHPSASVRVLLDNMESEFGLQFIFPSDVKEKIKALYIPAITQKADPEYNYFDAAVTGYIKSGSAAYVTISQSNYVDGCRQGRYETDNRGVIDIDDTSEPWQLSVSIQGNMQYINMAFFDGRSVIQTIRLQPDNKGYCVYEGGLPNSVVRGHESCRVMFATSSEYIVNIGRITIKNPEIEGDISYGQRFSLGKNLKDISVIDLLKSLCWLYGLFAIKSTEGIQFIPVTIYDENKNNAVDWSKKLVPTGWTAKETSYTFGDFAQKNYFRYDENENTKSADGYIEVDNKTLETEKDLVELKFKAGGDNNNPNLIPYFGYNDDGGIKTVDCGARLMRKEAKRNGEKWLTFDKLDFETMLSSEYYQSYKSIVKSPFVIKDTFRLTEMDLKNIDYTIPVYIERYAAFFAIISIKSQGDYSECELLKLL